MLLRMHLLLPLLFPWTHADILPVQNFLQHATSQTLPHPNHAHLHNHYYVVNPDQKIAIVFLPGMGESSIKYHDLYEGLKLHRSTFYSWDHIGQGFSSHLLTPKDIVKVHIDSFDTHLAALENFLKKMRFLHTKIFIIGHSMGAHLALRLATDHPNLVDGLILSAPLFDMNAKIKPGRFLSWILTFFPSEDYPPLYSFFIKKNMNMGFVTNSLERQKEFQKTLTLFPQVKRQGATVGWILAANSSIEKLTKTDFKDLKQHVLLLQADTDYLVDNTAQDLACTQMPYCQKEIMKNSKHEILFEIDSVRNEALTKIQNFIRSLEPIS